MPDATLTQALREAMATAPADEVVYDTLELSHPGFTEPLRVIADRVALDARLETGTLVTFVPYAFRLTPPEVADDAAPALAVEIDNVDRLILAQLDAAVSSESPVNLVWRRFVASTAQTGPAATPVTVPLTEASADVLTIHGRASHDTLYDRVFPGLTYEIDDFPGVLP